MVRFGQLVLSGLGFGGVYALAALGLVLIYKVSNVINFAYGALAMVVTMVLWSGLREAGLPTPAAWVLSLLAALVLGAVAEVVFLRRIQRAPFMIQIGVTIGLLLLVEGLAGVIWGYSPKAIPAVLHGPPVPIGSLFITRNDLFIVGLTVVLGLGFGLLYQRTRLGLAVRAVAEDREVANLMGIRSGYAITMSWAVGTLVTGVAAILVAPAVGLSPTFMDEIAIFAFAAAVVGGFGSLVGAVVGGFLIGIVSDLIAGYISTNLELALVFLLVLLVLYARPQGIFQRVSEARQ